MKKNENISLKKALDEDCAKLAQSSKEAFHTDVLEGIAPSIWDPGGPPGYDSPDFQKFIISVIDAYKILLDNEIVGGIYVDSYDKAHCILERIFVSPVYHNMGVASRAIELIHSKYPEANIWTLGTPRWNARTRHFYEKHGYLQVGWDKSEFPAHPKMWGVWYQKTIKPYQFTKISQIVNGMKAVSVEGKVAGMSEPKEITLEDGKKIIVGTAELTDNTGTIDLALGENHLTILAVGNKIRVENAIVSSYQDKLKLEITYGRIISLSDIAFKSMELV